MGGGHGGVAAEQQADQGPADQVGATDDHRFGSFDLGSGMVEQLDHPGRGAGNQSGPASGQKTGVGGGQAVDVLGRIDCRDHRVGIDVIGRRQLDEDSVDLVIVTERLDQGDQILLAGIRGQFVVNRVDARRFTGLVLVGDVDMGCRVVADQHRRQDRLMAARLP